MNRFCITVLCTFVLISPSIAFAQTDSDGDGVADIKDACPHTEAGAQVDAAGCAKPKLFEPVCFTTTSDDLYPTNCAQGSQLSLLFEFAKAEVMFSQWQILARVNQFLLQHDVRLCLVGYSDSLGTDEANLQLSHQRAANVLRILVEDYGFKAERFTLRAMGSLSPIASNERADGRALNRRVEFVVDLSR